MNQIYSTITEWQNTLVTCECEYNLCCFQIEQKSCVFLSIFVVHWRKPGSYMSEWNSLGICCNRLNLIADVQEQELRKVNINCLPQDFDWLVIMTWSEFKRSTFGGFDYVLLESRLIEMNE